MVRLLRPDLKTSLRATFTGLWLLIILICAALALLMSALYQSSVGVQVRAVQTEVEKASAAIQTRFAFYLDSFSSTPEKWDAPQRQRELNLVLQLVLADYPGVEGGFWTAHDPTLAYAFPTYEGDRVKKDLPVAESGRISETAAAALAAQSLTTRRFDAQRESLVISARVASSGATDLAIWAMARARVSASAANSRLTLGFTLLLLFALLSGALLLWKIGGWLRRIRGLENAIAAASLEDLPPLPATGERELDRIVTALNGLSARLQTAREESRVLGRNLAKAERTGALGRMAAQISHEIRNPIAAIRLRAENALAKTPEHQRAALESALVEIRRLDDLLERLLAVTRLHELKPETVALAAWLRARLTNVEERAEKLGVRCECAAPEGEASFDPRSMSRALDNLLLNALQQSPNDGTVRLSAQIERQSLRIRVEDSGSGISAEQKEAVFEPFTTGRAEGAGLGLTIAREIVEAHGGTLALGESTLGGACFEIELPQNPDRS